MKASDSRIERARWLELLEKHKDKLSIENLQKVRNAVQRTQNSWGTYLLKLDMLCLEYPLKGECGDRE